MPTILTSDPPDRRRRDAGAELGQRRQAVSLYREDRHAGVRSTARFDGPRGVTSARWPGCPRLISIRPPACQPGSCRLHVPEIVNCSLLVSRPRGEIPSIVLGGRE